VCSARCSRGAAVDRFVVWCQSDSDAMRSRSTAPRTMLFRVKLQLLLLLLRL